MELILNKKFKRRVAGLFEKYEFETGILRDGPHYPAKPIIKSFAGGDARQIQKGESNIQISEVSEANRKRMGVNYLTAPFQKRSSDIIKFSNEFFKLVFGRSSIKRAENLIQAIVRNPILRGDYGSNTAFTQKIKGFDRNMIDTAQLFRSITAKVKLRRPRV